MARKIDTATRATILTMIDTRKYSLRQIAKKINKTHTAVQTMVKRLISEGYIDQPVRISHKSYRSSKSIYTVTAKGKEFIIHEKIMLPPDDHIGPNNVATPRQQKPFLTSQEKGEYTSLHRGRIFIPFNTQRPATLDYLAFRTDQRFTPRTEEGTLNRWNYAKNSKADMKQHKMKNWDWYSFTESNEGKDLSILVYRKGIYICVPDIQFPDSEKINEIILEKYIRPMQPIISQVQDKLNRYFIKDLRSWLPKLKEAEHGMYEIVFTGEIALVGDKFAKVTYDSGKHLMKWYGEDGKVRMTIDHSHKENPELEFTAPGSFIDDAEGAKSFRDGIGKDQYRDMARNMEHKEFGDMILDHVDGKWSYREEQEKLKMATLRLENGKLELENLKIEMEKMKISHIKEITELKAENERITQQNMSIFISVAERFNQIADILEKRSS